MYIIKSMVQLWYTASHWSFHQKLFFNRALYALTTLSFITYDWIECIYYKIAIFAMFVIALHSRAALYEDIEKPLPILVYELWNVFTRYMPQS